MKQATVNNPHPGRAAARLLLAALALACALAPQAAAQKRFSRDYPAQPNIRLQLLNRSGKIEVVAWEKSTVRVTATMESRSAKMEPEATADGVRIDVRRDNREDVGDINFTIRVPYNSTVDISTMSGGIVIRNVRGEMVRAHVTSEGDIELTGIRARTVMAENTVGNILFDAELLRGGTYVLNSTQGDIQLRITAEDRKSTRLNSSHLGISYAVFCLKKKSKERATCQHDKRETTHCANL